MIPMAPALDTAEARSAAGDPSHRGLDDGDLHAEQLGDPVGQHTRILAWPRFPTLGWGRRCATLGPGPPVRAGRDGRAGVGGAPPLPTGTGVGSF